MRHVPYDPQKITYPDGWAEKQKNAIDEVAKVSPDKISETVNKHRNVWADLKPALSDVFHKKCWYTETVQTGTDTD